MGCHPDRSEGEGTAGRTLECFCLGCETVFTLPNVFSRSVFVYYNLTFCNISGRKLGFPNSYNPTAEFRVIWGSFCCLTGNCSQGLVYTRQTLPTEHAPALFYSLPEMSLSSLFVSSVRDTGPWDAAHLCDGSSLLSQTSQGTPHRHTDWCASMVIPNPTKLTKKIGHHITFPMVPCAHHWYIYP